jgi:hypothetical protein
MTSYRPMDDETHDFLRPGEVVLGKFSGKF